MHVYVIVFKYLISVIFAIIFSLEVSIPSAQYLANYKIPFVVNEWMDIPSLEIRFTCVIMSVDVL